MYDLMHINEPKGMQRIEQTSLERGSYKLRDGNTFTRKGGNSTRTGRVADYIISKCAQEKHRTASRKQGHTHPEMFVCAARTHDVWWTRSSLQYAFSREQGVTYVGPARSQYVLKHTPSRAYLQYEARLSPGNPKLGLRRQSNCRQRREDTFTIPAFLCFAQ